MLDVSRITSGKLSIRREAVDLTSLVRRVADDLAPYAATTGSVLEVMAFEPIQGFWDTFRVEQIVVNLISNAVRYGQGQPVEISLAHTQNSAVIEVRDHGIGINARDQERIFDAFERVLHQDRTGGLGLGLFITKQLVDAHGGAITLQSQPGNGALFSVTLPLAGS